MKKVSICDYFTKDRGKRKRFRNLESHGSWVLTEEKNSHKSAMISTVFRENYGKIENDVHLQENIISQFTPPSRWLRSDRPLYAVVRILFDRAVLEWWSYLNPNGKSFVFARKLPDEVLLLPHSLLARALLGRRGRQGKNCWLCLRKTVWFQLIHFSSLSLWFLN